MIRGHFAADLGIEAEVIQDGFVSREIEEAIDLLL
jgi:hypothetical protein